MTSGLIQSQLQEVTEIPQSQWLFTLLDAAPDPMLLVEAQPDRRYIIARVNPALNQFGFEPRDLAGKDIQMIFAFHLFPSQFSELRQILNQGAGGKLILRVQTPQGKLVSAEVMLIPCRMLGNNSSYWLIHMRDVTSQMDIEQQLLRSIDKLSRHNTALKRSLEKEAFMHALNRLVRSEKDLERVVGEVAQSLAQALRVDCCVVGIPGKDGHMIRMAWHLSADNAMPRKERIPELSVVPPLPAPEQQAEADDLKKQEGSSALDSAIYAPYKPRAALLSGCYYNGAVNGFVCLLQENLTRKWQPHDKEMLQVAAAGLAIAIERVRMLWQLQEARDLAELRAGEMKFLLDRQKELNVLQSDFISMASHEFKTPLAIIDSSAQLMHRFNARGAPPEEKHIQRIRQAVSRMSDLISSTLNLSTLENKRVKMELEKFDLRALLEQQVDHFRHIHTDRRIESRCQRAEGEFYGDRKLIEQIVNNLLANACKYSQAGGRAALSARLRSGVAVICVEDDGMGITPEDQRQLFEKFFRGNNSEGIAGTGIGLYLVKSFVEMHGGKIKIHSQIGKGSRFTVLLPSQKIQTPTGGDEP